MDAAVHPTLIDADGRADTRADRWFADETVEVAERWVYLYGAIDSPRNSDPMDVEQRSNQRD